MKIVKMGDIGCVLRHLLNMGIDDMLGHAPEGP